jgi:hypothetical protein
MPKITKEMETKYLKDNGLYCPFCESDDLYVDDFNGPTMAAEVICNNCHKSWLDILKLTGIKEIEE